MGATAGGFDETDHESDQLEPEDTLDYRGVADVLDEGYSPPERPWVGDGWGTTALEEAEGESLDARLARELPDGDGPTRATASATASDTDGELWDDEVGDLRSGRLVDSDQGVAPDTDDELYAVDIGIDGAGASAEEAAVHVVPRGVPARRRLSGRPSQAMSAGEGQRVHLDGDVRAGGGQVGGPFRAGHPDPGGKFWLCATTWPVKLTVSPASTS